MLGGDTGVTGKGAVFGDSAALEAEYGDEGAVAFE